MPYCWRGRCGVYRTDNKWGLSDRIKFIGKRYDAARFYSIADIFVVTSIPEGRMESGPVTLLEAMASGVIVLGTKIGGMLDMLSELPDQLIESKKPLLLADKIKKYINLPRSEKQAIVNKQLSILKQNFTLEQEIERHTNLYHALIK